MHGRSLRNVTKKRVILRFHLQVGCESGFLVKGFIESAAFGGVAIEAVDS